MVRSKSPLPFLYRTRSQHAFAARGRVRKPYRPTRSLILSPSLYTAKYLGHRRGAAVGIDLPTWCDFIEKYERFTSILCETAKNGGANISARAESEYVALRHWFLENYIVFGGRLRPYLAEVGARTGIKAKIKVVHRSTGFRRSMDALEQMFVPVTLVDVLRQDMGDLIQRISKISDAVYRCFDEHSPR